MGPVQASLKRHETERRNPYGDGNARPADQLANEQRHYDGRASRTDGYFPHDEASFVTESEIVAQQDSGEISLNKFQRPTSSPL